MKPEPIKQPAQNSLKDKFRLINNENYPEPRKPRPPVKIVVDQPLPPAA